MLIPVEAEVDRELRPVETEATPLLVVLMPVEAEVDSEVTLLLVVERPVEAEVDSELRPVDTEATPL